MLVVTSTGCCNGKKEAGWEAFQERMRSLLPLLLRNESSYTAKDQYPLPPTRLVCSFACGSRDRVPLCSNEFVTTVRPLFAAHRFVRVWVAITTRDGMLLFGLRSTIGPRSGTPALRAVRGRFVWHAGFENEKEAKAIETELCRLHKERTAIDERIRLLSDEYTRLTGEVFEDRSGGARPSHQSSSRTTT